MIRGGYFITGSRYSGDFQHEIGIMDGFGTYVFPNGSEYRGYFKMGKFHGYGTLSVKTPNKMLYIAKFKNGTMDKIEEIVFGDGVRIQNDDIGPNFDFKKWNYLCTDRRFASEIFSGIKPVGPGSLLTNIRPARDLPHNTYDTGDGFFHPRSGFTGVVFTGNAFETRPPRFVACKEEFNWICRHCRRSNFMQLPEEIQTQIDQNVLQNNLKYGNATCTCGMQRMEDIQEQQQLSENEDNDVFPSDEEIEVEQELKIEDQHGTQSLKDDSLRSSCFFSNLSSSSETSFAERSLIIDLKCENKPNELIFIPEAFKKQKVVPKNIKSLIRPSSLSSDS